MIIESLPGVIVCLSCPTDHVDNLKAKITIHHLRNKLSGLNIDYISNDNTNITCRSKGPTSESQRFGRVGYELSLVYLS